MHSGTISPHDWGLAPAPIAPDWELRGLSISAAALEQRIQANTYQWLPLQLDAETGAYYGHYRAPDRYREPPQTANLIASWQLMAAFDRYHDPHLLERATRALEFYYRHFVVSHPMSIVNGGARDGSATHEVWTKYSAEFVVGALGLFRRTGNLLWLERATQSGRFLVQATRHGFAPRYFLDRGRWAGLESGWDSWGRVIAACLGLAQATGDARWQELALRWGEHALAIQAQDGCFYLIDQEYYNTDLAADELRGLAFLYEITGEERFLAAARRFADWHLAHQRPDGAWALTQDHEGNLVTPTVGPGDMPNIGIALLRLHHLTRHGAYLDAALRAFSYSLSKQVLPGSTEPYADDPCVQWGFWSWEPYYDYTVSADQATHHIRGMMFLLDYLSSLNTRDGAPSTPCSPLPAGERGA